MGEVDEAARPGNGTESNTSGDVHASDEEDDLVLVNPEDLLAGGVGNEVHHGETIVLSNTTGGEPEVDDDGDTIIDFNFTDFNSDTEEPQSGCDDNEALITIELQTDRFGEDCTWELLPGDGSPSFNTTAALVSRGPYGEYSFDMVDVCVPSPGLYTFNIHDSYGDGLCSSGNCGTRGYYKLYLEGKELVHVNHYALNNTHVINAGYDATSNMTERDELYLQAHNWRRKHWHESYNRTYVPLQWSPRLAEESLAWAAQLLDACDSNGIEHEPGVPEGENLAKNKGLLGVNNTGWGQVYHPENITRRWVEREIGWSYPENAHLTQSLWRASRYLGCGEAEKDYRGGKCRVQVCRYAQAGNCDMGRYDATEGVNWLIPMLKDTSPCEPSCPPEGCY